MIWLIILSIVLLIPIILAFLPVGIRAVYNQEGFCAFLSVGPVKIPLYPRQSKEKEKEKPDKKKSGKKESKDGGSYTDFLPLLKNAFDLAKELRLRFIIRKLECKLVLAGGDPCDLAINYGRAWAAVGNLIPMLEHLFTIKKRDLSVNCDFTAEKTTIYFRIHGSLPVYRVIIIAVTHGIPFLKKFLTIQNQRKGGTKV